MRSLLGIALVPALLLGVLAAGSSFNAAEAGSPPADLSGFYAGSLKFRSAPLSTDRPERAKHSITLSVTQNGTNLDATLTVFTEEDGNLEFPLSGQVGNGRFWLISLGEGGSVLLTGAARGASPGRKVKASGTFFDSLEFATLQISAKESDI